jgi:tetratricopeptide (TPR) repeat protein
VKHPCIAILLVGTVLSGQEDPLAATPEIQAWARQTTLRFNGTKQKLQGLLDAIFHAPSESGFGLGVLYDNSRTRTVKEVWQERRANCMSLTAFFLAACHAAGIEAKYAEPLNTNRWRRSGNLVRLERHVVTLVPIPPMDDAVADFLPQLRRRMGFYVVSIINESRFRALFHSNRAVEMLDQGLKEDALSLAKAAVAEDPTSAVGWNVQGVVQQSLGETLQSEACYRRAMALDPKDGTPVGNMEQLCRSQGRFEEAMRLRMLGTELRKKDPYFHAFLAEEAMDAGNWDEAQKEIKAAIKIQPYEPEFHLAQARIHLERGQADAALKSLEEARRWAIPEERDRYDTKIGILKK